MKTTITVKICVSTYSYVMGGASLMGIMQEIPERLKNNIKVEGSLNLVGGNEDTGAKPPYAEVNGIFIEEATAAKIIELILLEFNKSSINEGNS